jgi:hypothetical protein
MNMMRLLAMGLCLTVLGLSAAETNLAAELEPLRVMLDGPWRGEFKNPAGEKPVADVMKWERALNGQAIRITHSLNDGAYGGESFVTWDAAKKSIVYHYFTTAGFRTEGTMELAGDGKIKMSEKVIGNAGGATEVRSMAEMKDGTFLIKSEHLRDGKWAAARETLYKKDPNAKVTFR